MTKITKEQEEIIIKIRESLDTNNDFNDNFIHSMRLMVDKFVLNKINEPMYYSIIEYTIDLFNSIPQNEMIKIICFKKLEIYICIYIFLTKLLMEQDQVIYINNLCFIFEIKKDVILSIERILFDIFINKTNYTLFNKYLPPNNNTIICDH